MLNSRVKHFPISGIERNTDPLTATPGAMEDCLNLAFRNKDALSVQAVPQTILPERAGRAYSYIHSLLSGERILISVDAVDTAEENGGTTDAFVPGTPVTGHYKVVASHRATSDGAFELFQETALCEVHLQNGQIAFSSNGNLLLVDFVNEVLIPTAKTPTITQGNNQNRLRVMLRDTTQDVTTQSGWLELGGGKKQLDTPEKLPEVWIEKRNDATGNALYYYCGQDKRSGFVYGSEIKDKETLKTVEDVQKTDIKPKTFSNLTQLLEDKMREFAAHTRQNTAATQNVRQALYLWYEDSYTEQFVPDNAPLMSYVLKPYSGNWLTITNIEDLKKIRDARDKAQREYNERYSNTSTGHKGNYYPNGRRPIDPTVNSRIALAGQLGFPKGDFTDYLGLCKDYLLTQTDYLYERILLFAVVKLFDGTYLHPSRIYDVGAVRYACMRMQQEESRGRQGRSGNSTGDGKGRGSYPTTQSGEVSPTQRGREEEAKPLPPSEEEEAKPLTGDETTFYPIDCCGHFYSLESFSASLNIPTHLNDAKHLQLIDSLELYAFRFDPYLQPDKHPYVTEETEVLKLSARFADRGILSEATDFRLVASAPYRNGAFHIKLTSKDKKTLFNSGNFASLSPLFYPLDRFAQEPAFDWSRIVPVKHILAKRYTYNRRNFLYQMKEFPTLAECLPEFNPIVKKDTERTERSNGIFFSVRTTEGDTLYPLGRIAFYEQGEQLGSYGLPYFYSAIPWIDEITLYDNTRGESSFDLTQNGLRDICPTCRIKLYKHPVLPISFAEENNPKYPLAGVNTSDKYTQRYTETAFKNNDVLKTTFCRYGRALKDPPKNRDFFLWKEHTEFHKFYPGALAGYRDKPNSVKVLTTDNPIGGIAGDTFMFPAPVRALAVLQMTPEEYHFGSYPTLVFTGNGIYALRQNDTGEHYIAVVPLLPDVVTSRNVAVTPRGVAYVSEGHVKLYLNSATCVSEPIAYDLLPTYPRPDYKSLSTKYKTDFPYFPTAAPFEENCVADTLHGEPELYYDDRDHVLILPFPHRVSLCLNLDYMQWTRRTSGQVRMLTSRNRVYPIAYSGALRDWGRVGASGEATPILLQTKPFTLGEPARVEELRVNGTSHPAHRLVTYEANDPAVVTYGAKPLGVYAQVMLFLYGSNDATHFTLLGARHFPQPERHLILPLNRTHAFRYYSFTLIGNVSEGCSDFLSFDLTYSTAFNNRLR